MAATAAGVSLASSGPISLENSDHAALLDALPQGVLLLAPDSVLTILYLNRTAAKILAARPGQALASLVQAGELTLTATAVARVVETGLPQDNHSMVVRGQQDELPLLCGTLSPADHQGEAAVLFSFSPCRPAQAPGTLFPAESDPYGQFFHMSAVGMSISAPDTRTIQVNDRLCEILGFRREEMLEYTWPKVTHPDDLHREMELFEELVSGQRHNYSLEKRLIRKDRRIIHVRRSVSCLRDPSGVPVRIMALVEDITDHKAAQRALAQSERRFRTLFEQAPMAYQAMDADARLREVNQRWLSTLGYRREEVIGRWFGDFLAPGEEQIFQAHHLDLRLHGEMEGLEIALLHKDGRRVEVSFDCAMDRDREGRFRYTHCVFQDISERKSAQAALLASEERNRTLVQAMPVSLAVVQDYKWIYLNPAGCRILGLSPFTSAPPKPFWDYMHPDDHELIRERLENATNGAPNPGRDLRVIRSDGSEVTLHSVSVPIMYQDRPAVMILSQDVSENRSLEQERDSTIELLRLVNQAGGMEELARSVTRFIKDWMGVDAVGLRLRRGDDYPYYESVGLSSDFVAKENSLCRPGRLAGEEGFLGCVCGAVLEGRTNPDQPFFTANGSFFTNSTSDLLAEHGGELPPETRNRCHGEGYESVALIPLKVKEECLGLIQLLDRRRGVLTPHRVSLLERAANQLSVAFGRQRAEESVKSSLKEKEVLLREIHHRVKNNMQVISSLLSLQTVGLSDPQQKGPLLDCRNRVRAMALIHETLYQSNSLVEIDLGKYLRELTREITMAMAPGKSRPELLLKADGLTLNMDQAVPAGIIVNELVHNALRHGAPAKGRARISVTARRRENGEVELVVADNGPGLPGGRPPAEPGGLGLHLVTGLTESQLNGRWRMENRNGLKVTLNWPS